MGSKKFSLFESKPDNSYFCPEQTYLLGIRGFLVPQCFILVFLQTFAPAAVKDSANISGPAIHILLRKTLSILLWNENLLYSWFIILSARTICVPFIKNPTRIQFASLAFRRLILLLLPVAVALALVTIIFHSTGVDYIARFRILTENISFEVPYRIPTAVAYFNSIFNLFWLNRDLSEQAASVAFPSQTLWVLSVLYSQSYTIFLTMVIIPYTRNQWRVNALAIFIFTAWWVQSWAWYSITGLFLADAIMSMDFKAKSQRGINIWRSICFPSWILYAAIMIGGLVMQYLWQSWKPDLKNRELQIHTGEYSMAAVDNYYVIGQPQARDDNYLIIVGFLLLVETSDFLQYIFNNPLFLYLGRRSFCTSDSLIYIY
jgi:hypothetical protein